MHEPARTARTKEATLVLPPLPDAAPILKNARHALRGLALALDADQ